MTFLGEQGMDRRTWASPGGWGSDGEYDKGSATDSTFRGTWRPAPISTVQILPEGDRARDPRVLYTQTQLQTNSQHDGTPGDYVRPTGSTAWYEVTDWGDSIASLPDSAIKHWKYIALRVQEADG